MDTNKLNKQSSLYLFFISLSCSSFLFIIKNINYYLLINLILILILNQHYVNSLNPDLNDSSGTTSSSSSSSSNNNDADLQQYLETFNEEFLINRINLNLNELNANAYSPYTATQTANIKPKLVNINNIKYYNGYLYVGAQNWLLKLNADTLKIEQSVRYGPVLDSPACRYNPIEECTNSQINNLNLNQFTSAPSSVQSKYVMNNFNKLLIVYEQKGAILTCWTARQGVCDLRNLNDITQLIQNSSIPVVPNDPFNSTVGFIASAANSQDLFYIASTHNNLGPYRDEVPALAGRSLNIQAQLIPSFSSNTNRFMQILTSNSQGLKSSKASIEFISRFSKSFIVKYINAFNLGIYNYFLSVQHMDTEASLRGDLLITKLARLCLNDLSFTKSYTEMPLRCSSGSRGSISSLRSFDYNELISAKLINIKNLENNEFEISNDHYIIGLFQQTNRNTFNSSLKLEPDENGSIKQAVCVFPLKYIQAKIKENLRKCYDSGSQTGSYVRDDSNTMRGLSFIKPDQKCATGRNRFTGHSQSERSSDYSSSSQIGDDFCSSADNGLYPIGGQIPAISNAILEFDTLSTQSNNNNNNNVYFDTIQAYSDSVATSILLMSNKREEIRYYHLKSLTQPPINYRTVNLSKFKPTNAQQSELVKVSFSNLQFQMEPLNTHNSQYSLPPNLFVSTTNNQIYKLKMSSCESYKTCGECLLRSSMTSSSSGDPYCGWCPILNECTTQFKCMNAESSQPQSSDSTPSPLGSPKWINGGQLQINESSLIDSMCVDIQSVTPSVTYKGHADWIEISFRKDLIKPNDQNDNSSSYQCIFMSPVDTISSDSSTKLTVFKPAELKTDAIQISPSKLKCSLPHLTKLLAIFQSNQFKEQKLTFGEDGIFKVSPTSSYYYETQFDRIVLPFYVQNTQSLNIQYGTVPPTTLSKSTGIETTFNITIIDCSVHKSCISCASSQCQWCSNKCLTPSEKAIDSTGKCSSDVSTCKSFDTGTSKLLIPYTAHRQQAPLVFSLINIIKEDVFASNNEPNIECMFTMFNGRFVGRNVSLPFVFINKTHAHCSLANVFNSLSVFIDDVNNTFEDTSSSNQNLGQVQTNLRLYDSNNDFFIDSISNGKLSLLFYKCEIKANDCSQCLSLNRQFSCMWCNTYPLLASTTTKSIDQKHQLQSSCRFMNAQSKLVAASQCIAPINTLISASSNQSRQIAVNQCDKPQISTIQPSKLPVGGGTLLVINGVNLGSTVDDILNVNIVCGLGESSVTFSLNSNPNTVSTKCDLVASKYVPSKQIACKTRQSINGAQKQCRVSVKLRSNLLIGSSGATASLDNPNNALMNILVSGSQVIEYVDPLINDIQPGTIIQSANFVWLNIRGVDLDAGRTRQIQIIDYANSHSPSNSFYNDDLFSTGQQADMGNSRTIKCDIKNVTSKEIKCRLNDKFRTLGKKNFKIIFDDSMSIVSYLSLRVTSDPLVKSIDKQITLYSGGTQFKLYGFNFDAVQSVYTYVVYKDLWYSEPVQARARLSNELILFDFPVLNDAFFDLVKQQQLVFTAGFKQTQHTVSPSTTSLDLSEKYELRIGFLMDGFNVTLKNMPVFYMPNPTPQLISVLNVDIRMSSNDKQTFSLIIDLKIDESFLQYLSSSQSAGSGILKDDFQVYIGCSLCTKYDWLNETRLTCQLPSLVNQLSSNQTVIEQQQQLNPNQICEQKVFNSILSNLNLNRLNLVHFFIGNYELSQQREFGELNENLRIYIETYTINNIDGFSSVANALAVMTSSNDQNLINNRLKHMKTSNQNDISSISTDSSNKLLLIASIIGSFLVVLIGFTIILVTIIFRMKRKCKKLDTDHNCDNLNSLASANRLTLILNGHNGSKRGIGAKRSFMGTAGNTKKNEKHIKLEYESILQQVDLLELNVRSQCAQLFQQLHQDYVNELNHELMYPLSLPIWNYKTYLFNILFPSSNSVHFNNLLAIEMPNNVTSPSSNSSSSSNSASTGASSSLVNATNMTNITSSTSGGVVQHTQQRNLIISNAMSSSSMSNSTTNTLLSSTLTPIQKQQLLQLQQQQQLNSTMSVYATIKSSSMLRFDGLDTSTSHHHDPNLQFNKNHYAGLGNIGEAMQLFDQLIHNKNFLLTFIQVCESQSNNSFTLKDRCHFASLLMLGLKDNLPYLYSIIKSLLSDYIASSFQSNTGANTNSSKSQSINTSNTRAKLLFRSNESLIEPLLTNWLAMFMYDYQRDTQSSTHFYRLIRVIKFYLDMGPSDQLTQLGAHTLSEERLLKDSVLYQPIYVNVVNQCMLASNQTSVTSVQVCRLLDCDTVQQAKEKIIDSLYKTNSSLKPTHRDVELELCLIVIQNDQANQQEQQQKTSVITLKETEEELIGNSMEMESHLLSSQATHLKRLLTLKDYNIQNGSFLNLTYKQTSQQQQQQPNSQSQQHVYMSTLSMGNEYSLYATNAQIQSVSHPSNQLRKPIPTPPLPLPLVPPPQLPLSQLNRYHLVKPNSINNSNTQTHGTNMLMAFSAGCNGSSSSSSSSPSGDVNQSLTGSNKKKQLQRKKKKYEKLLTVKSQDSAVTTTSLITTAESNQQTTQSTTNTITRLLTNKITLQPFIDQFVETIFSNISNLPPVIQHLFEFFDQEAKKYQYQFVSMTNKDATKNLNQINDELNKITRTWKTNTYFMRYWVNLIKNPEILFDTQKSCLVDSTLTCIAQAFLDSCLCNDTNNLYDTNSPINRLLFIREVPRYKQMIDNFYNEIQTYQSISDHELHFYLNEFSKCQQQQQMSQQLGCTLAQNQPNGNTNANDINSIQILTQLYEYYEKYEQQINQALGQQQCSILLPVHHRLVQIKDLMLNHSAPTCNLTASNGFSQIAATLNRSYMPTSTQQNITFNPILQNQIHNLNNQMYNPYQQYQQPVNCYAATSDLLPNHQTQTNSYPIHTLASNSHQQFQQSVQNQKFF